MSATMNALLEAKASLTHSAFCHNVDGYDVVSCSEMAKKLVLAEEKARRHYVENTRKAKKLRAVYKLDEEKLLADFKVLKFLGCEIFAETLPDHMTKQEFVNFVVTIYGAGRDRSATQRLFQLMDSRDTGQVSLLDVLIYCEPILSKPVLTELASCGQHLSLEQFKRLNITGPYK